MPAERLLLRDAIGGFAPGQALRAALLLTYTFDGAWLEEGLVPDLFDRQVNAALVIRDGNALIREAPGVRYHRANAQFSSRVFHSKLVLLVADDRALAIIGSANLTRGGLERNLELASAYELSPAGGPRSLFEKLWSYLSGPLLGEVEGASVATVIDTHVALGEVIKRAPKEPTPRHAFLHNYDTPLWEQLLAQLPHRHVARVSIISPFFEPNRAEADDPELAPGDGAIFARLFADLKLEPPVGEKPVTVYFQASEGKTLLPIDTLRPRESQIALRMRLATSDDARPLHAKLLVIEGAGGPRRDPYLVVMHGSPNFTSAALLACPPTGNAEIAVLTRIPWKRRRHAQIGAALQLDARFVEVRDWKLLRHVAPDRKPLPGPGAFRVGDVSLQVAERKLVLRWRGSTSGAQTAHVLIEVDGAWVSIGSVSVGDHGTAELSVPLLATSAEDGPLTLQASRVRVELRDEHGATVASSEAPINVDRPADFCGLKMAAPLMATLDEQIAHAGCGVPMTYREQLRFLEQHRARRKDGAMAVSVLTHQADLDRFFRNLSAGFNGLRARRDALAESEYTLRRTLRDLGRWCADAIHDDSKVPTVECRVFLVDRLGRELEQVLETAEASRKLSPRLGSVLGEFEIPGAVTAAATWARALVDRGIASYLKDTVKRLDAIEHKIGGLP